MNNNLHPCYHHFMNQALINFILLFILSLHFTQQHEIFPTSTFPLSYFGLLLLALTCYLLSASLSMNHSKTKPYLIKIQVAIFIFITIITIGRTSYSAINLRHQLGEAYPVHDNPIQIEEGVKLILSGKNPYTEDYQNTALGRWHSWEDNPAIYHFITLPFYIFLSAVISIPSTLIFGFFDERMVHILALGITIMLIHKLVKPLHQKILFLTLFLFNPMFIHFFVEGRNDIFVYTAILASLWYLDQRQILRSSLYLGFAVASKQSSWLILPFYFWYLFQQEFLQIQAKNLIQKIVATAAIIVQKTWPFFVTVIVLFGSFLIWDAPSFIADIYQYPAGTLPTSYPIKGFGFSELLVQKNIIINRGDYYPFIYWQLGIGIPVMIWLLWQQTKRKTISFLIFSYGIFLLTFWYFSRFFVENYLGYLTMIFLIGVIFHEKEQSKNHK